MDYGNVYVCRRLDRNASECGKIISKKKRRKHNRKEHI